MAYLLNDEFQTVVAVARKGDWCQTYTGKQFWPLDPRPEDVDIRDIAHALAYQCRYTGHCLSFYSVAEHCVHVSKHVSAGNALAALMHDAAEAYISDVPRPLKPYLTNFERIESEIEEVIAERYRLAYPWHPEIKQADTRILADERVQVMEDIPVSDMEWGAVLPPLGVELHLWGPEEAEMMFLYRFNELYGFHP